MVRGIHLAVIPMSASKWRQESRRIIYEIMSANRDVSQEEFRTLLTKAYPCGERGFHPYRIWCDEVNKALSFRERLQRHNAEVMRGA